MAPFSDAPATAPAYVPSRHARPQPARPGQPPADRAAVATGIDSPTRPAPAPGPAAPPKTAHPGSPDRAEAEHRPAGARGEETSPDQSPARQNRPLGVVAILVSATAMGTAGVFGRVASPPDAVIGEALTMGRMLVGALGMLAILAFTRRAHLLRTTRMSWSVVLGGVSLGLSLALLLWSVVLTSLGVAVALHYLGPVLATVAARVILKESPSRVEVISLSGAFIGMLLTAGLLGGAGTLGSGDGLLGAGLGLASGVFYGAALLCYRFRADMPADVRSFWTFLFGTVATGGMVLVMRPDLSAMTTANWIWAAVFFAVCGLLALGLLVLAGMHLRTAELSSLSYWEVVVAMLLGAWLFAETISVPAGIGAGLIVVAAALPLVLTRRATGSKSAAPGRRIAPEEPTTA